MTAAKHARKTPAVKKTPARKKKAARKVIPPEIEASLLTKSLRRCTLCFYLKGNLKKKHGQIAHLNGDRSNCKFDNLAWMCLKHHSIFDGTNSQHKNYTLKEVKDARAKLYKAIAKGEHLTYKKDPPALQPGLGADRQTLEGLLSLMAATGTIDFLRDNNFAGYSFDTNRLNGIGTYITQRGPERQFIDAELEALREAFHGAATKFLSVVGTGTWPMGEGHNSVPQEWELEEPERFQRVVTELHDGAALVCKSYDALVVAARRKLSA